MVYHKKVIAFNFKLYALRLFVKVEVIQKQEQVIHLPLMHSNILVLKVHLAHIFTVSHQYNCLSISISQAQPAHFLHVNWYWQSDQPLLWEH